MLIGQTTNTDEFSPLRLLFSHWHQTQDEMARYSKDTATRFARVLCPPFLAEGTGGGRGGAAAATATAGASFWSRLAGLFGFKKVADTYYVFRGSSI
jgi:hypothetical protein